MHCEHIQNLFQLYIENRLNSIDKAHVEEHLKNCRECAKFFAEFKGAIGVFGKTAKVKLPSGYHQKLALKIDGAAAMLKSRRFPVFSLRSITPAFFAFLFAAGIIYFARTPAGEYTPGLTTQNIMPAAPAETAASAIRESKPQTPVKKTAHAKSIEVKSTLELAKAPVENAPFILRGSGERPVTKRIIKQWQDVTSGVRTKKALVIENAAAWHALWQEHSRALRPAPPVPEVDFTKSLVVAVFMGEQQTGGYGIRIAKIEESDSKIYADTVETIPAGDSPLAQQLTQPYHITVLDK